jgi:hypothetical protein
MSTTDPEAPKEGAQNGDTSPEKAGNDTGAEKAGNEKRAERLHTITIVLTKGVPGLVEG